ncbi:hypothetical protein LROSL1_2323 [Furfurilactobacillus rossiae]|uniref:hypothetical protein n=1 Tax=Furfurilactobacillus rossiae TaxID=231049 RepID=UPI0015BAA6AE|nr:hypothetical protein [Furfurilactobacillus rossiae]MCF6166310.1 hypothetical protein [Furfurilactobacillus rossiae]QLE65124.1 hypothetical protein LROSL1_2323 [Furfurilactobacillus rossiae]
MSKDSVDLDLGIQTIELDSDGAGNVVDGVTATACCNTSETHPFDAQSDYQMITDGVTASACCPPHVLTVGDQAISKVIVDKKVA